MSQRALTELLRGQGAHADPLGCVEDLDADIAHRRIPGFRHSIADLVFHMNYWMNYERNRIRGDKPAYPEHNAESFPAADELTGEPSAERWDRLKRDFAWFLSEFAELSRASRAELDRELESTHEGDKKVASTLESILCQITAHNSYHTGQIALVRRALNAWPPKAGGDSW